MERKEAVALLKEMSASELADLSWVVLHEKNLGDYQLQIGSYYNFDFEAIEEFMDKNDLVFEEESINRFLVIRKR